MNSRLECRRLLQNPMKPFKQVTIKQPFRTENHVFADEEDELQNVKAMISKESGLEDPNAVEEEKNPSKMMKTIG